ncbi:MAG: hypothetical protein WD708_06640 [Kiritimatiellia bacterium]
MNKLFRLCCVLWVGLAVPLYAQMELVDYRGWEGAIQIRNSSLEVVVLPQTGGLIHLSAPGKENLLTFNADLAGELPLEEEGGWLNYGGDWMWPVHQDQWEKTGGARWPPLRMLDRLAWHADVEVDEGEPNALPNS